MKKRLAALLIAGLVTGMLGACGGETAYVPVGGDLQLPAEQTVGKEQLTVDALRTQTFSDLASDSPYYDAACYAVYYQLMEPADGAFGTYDMVTWGQVTEALWRLGGRQGQDAQAWCDGAGIPAGLTGTDTAPVTRQDLATVLLRAAEHFGHPVDASGDLSAYVDGQQVSDTAAMSWALESGVLGSIVARDRIQPKVPVSRLQLAQALVRLSALDENNALALEISRALPERAGSDSRDNHEAIAKVIESIARQYNAQGLQVAVVENGVLTDTYAYGWATRDTDPMTADHKMRIASISKVGVGLSAMLLLEEGIIGLDEDISRYWDCTVKNPKYPNMPITIRGMLTHTSSIYNAGDGVSREYSSVRSKLQGAGFSGAVPGDIGYWEYNNYAYSVLGMTLELAADRTLDDILGERLYSYMDIDAAYGSGDIRDTDRLVTLYRYGTTVSRTVAEQKNYHSSETPGANGKFFAGGLTTSATDLGKLLALLAGDGVYEGVRLMEASSVELMETRIETPTPGGSYQAHPMRYWENLYGREGIYFHTGSAYGVFNCFCYDPYTGDGVVVLTTGTGGAKDDYGIYKVCAAINNHIFRLIE